MNAHGLNKVYNIGIESLLIFLIIFSPLAYGSVHFQSFIVIGVVSALLVLIWHLKMASARRLSYFRPHLLLPLVLFIFLVILQLIPLSRGLIRFVSPRTAYLYNTFLSSEVSRPYTLSVYPNATLIELIKLLSYVGVYLVVLNNIESRQQFNRILGAIIVVGFVIGVFGIIQKYSYSGRVYWFDPPNTALTPFGPFANRNHFAGYMEMVIPLAIGYLLTDMQLSKKVFFGSMAGLMSLALFLSLSRAGVVLYVVIISFMASLSRIKMGLRGKTWVGLVILLTFLCLLLLLVGIEPLVERLATLFHGEPIIIRRGYGFTDGLKIALDFPLFGSGLGTFVQLSPKYRTTPYQGFLRYAHNDYLQLLIETGVVGLIFLGFFFFRYIRNVFRMWFRRRDHYVRGLVLGGMAAIFGILIHSLVDFNLHIPANALLFFIIMALTYRLVCTEFGRR